MAETVVLASLTVDSSGVITGFKAVDSVFTKTEKTIKNVGGTAQNFVGKLTNVTGALNIMGRSLGVLSLGLAAANGIRTLTSDLLNSIPAWKAFTGELESTYNWLVKNESAVGNLNRTLGERASDFARLMFLAMHGINPGPVAAGLRAADEQQMRDLLQGAITVGPNETPATKGLSLSGFKASIEDSNRLLANLQEMERLLESVITIGPFDNLDDIVPDEFLDDATQRLIFFLDQLDQIPKKIEPLPGVFEEARKSFADLIGDWLAQLDPAMAKFDLFMTAMQAVGNAIASAFLESGVTAREAVADLLKTIARVAITYALIFAAAGVAASTGLGSALLVGTPHQFFHAAALFAAVGVGAGLASKAIGGSEGGSERAASGGGGTATQTRGGSNVTVIVQGSLMGTDENTLARSIRALLTTAEADGAV